MKKIVNLTPHAVNVNGRVFPSAGCARCNATSENIGEVDGIPIRKTVFADVYGLPTPAEDTFYIVSVIVARACPQRRDLLITDGAIRDEKGQVIGCQALAVYYE